MTNRTNPQQQPKIALEAFKCNTNVKVMLSEKKFTLMSAAFSETLLELVKITAGTFK